jgi:hypothetical protein
MIQIKTTTKNSIPLKIGRRIEFLYAAWDNDVHNELKTGDLGTITDLSPMSRSNRHMISVDWDNGSRIALIENSDAYEVLSD